MSFETFDELLYDAGLGNCVELTDAIAHTVPSDDNVEAAAIATSKSPACGAPSTTWLPSTPGC